MERLNLFYPNIHKEDWLKALGKAFDTRWIGQGPMVDKFEKKFGKKFSYDCCIAVNSGTASLELAYELIGISKGDEVLAPVFTCTATNIPLVRRGADIKFIDVDDKLLASYEDISSKISDKTKALVVTNVGGVLVDRRIFDLAKKFRVPVVVDACQSLGVDEPEGDYICYSFQAIKHFTTGDGGMLIVKNNHDYERAKVLRWFGIDREAKKKSNWQWLINHKMSMDIEEPGYKYHMNDIAASMGMVGLSKSDETLAYRQKLCLTYDRVLSQYKKIYGGSCWMFAVLTDRRDEMIIFLREYNIECDIVQLRNDVFKIFGGKKQDLPNMNRLEDRYLYLPLNPMITVNNIHNIGEILSEFDKS